MTDRFSGSLTRISRVERSLVDIIVGRHLDKSNLKESQSELGDCKAKENRWGKEGHPRGGKFSGTLISHVIAETGTWPENTKVRENTL